MRFAPRRLIPCPTLDRNHTVSYGHARAGSRPLSPDDWARTALAAIARGGIGAVAVETVAAALGATKGSFYWHGLSPR